MMLEKFKLKSNLAFLSLGILVQSIIEINWSESLLLSYLLFLILLIPNYGKLGLFVLGAFLLKSSLVISIFFGFNSQKVYLAKEDFFNYQKNHKEIKIRIQNKYRKGFYNSEIEVNGFKTNALLSILQKDFDELNCNSKDMKFFEDYKTKDYSFYLSIQKKNCIPIINQTFSKKFREELINLIQKQNLEKEEKDISLGLILGDSSFIESELKEQIKEAGLLHLFAASGLHIGIFIGFIYFLTKNFFLMNHYTEKILPICFAFLYLFLLNFPVSFSRAFLFVFIIFLTSLFFRKLNTMDLILITSAILCLANPNVIKTVSFQLSFVAASSILLFKEEVDYYFFGKLKSFVFDSLSVSITASFFTLPILIYHFHSFSFGSILINTLLVPFASLILPLLYISLLFQISVLSLQDFINLDLIANLIWIPTSYSLKLLITWSQYLSQKISFYRIFQANLYLVFVFYFITLLAFFFLSFYKKNQLALRILSFTILLLFFLSIYNLSENKKASIEKNTYISFDSFLIKENNSLYISGTCKYSFHKMNKIIHSTYCNHIENIYLEKQACLGLALKCQRQNSAYLFYYFKSDFELESSLEVNEYFPKKFSNLIIFNSSKDSISSLASMTSTGSGSIAIIFPYKSKDRVEVWNQNKKLLGIREEWKFMKPDEL